MNAQGRREDPEVSPTKPPGTRRYLASGDSRIWGHSADQEATLDRGLEAQLPPRIGGAPVEVVNVGVPDAAASDMLVRWRARRGTLELDGVVLGAPKNVGGQAGIAAERTLWYRGGGAPYAPV